MREHVLKLPKLSAINTWKSAKIQKIVRNYCYTCKSAKVQNLSTNNAWKCPKNNKTCVINHRNDKNV